MSSNVDDIVKEARLEFSSPLPFTIRNGGLGAVLNCAVASTGNVPLTGTAITDGVSLVLTNPDDVIAYLTFGDSTVQPSLAGYPLPRGTQQTVTVEASVTHVAGITMSGTARVSVHRGGGS